VPNIKDIVFKNIAFQELSLNEIKGYVIYCDIPYKGTTKYATNNFPYEQFYDWVKVISKYNTVLISEYSMPPEFTCIWQKELKTSLGSGINKDSDKVRTEKLFTYKHN